MIGQNSTSCVLVRQCVNTRIFAVTAYDTVSVNGGLDLNLDSHLNRNL